MQIAEATWKDRAGKTATMLLVAALVAVLAPLQGAFAAEPKDEPGTQQNAPEGSSWQAGEKSDDGAASDPDENEPESPQQASEEGGVGSSFAEPSSDSDEAPEPETRVTRDDGPEIPDDADKAERVEESPVDAGCGDEHSERSDEPGELLADDPCADDGSETDRSIIPTARAPVRDVPNYSGDVMDRLCAGRGGRGLDTPGRHDGPDGEGGEEGEEEEHAHPPHAVEGAADVINETITNGFDGERDGSAAQVARTITSPFWVGPLVLWAFAIDEVRSFPLILNPLWEPDVGDDGTRGTDPDAALDAMCERYHARRSHPNARDDGNEAADTPCDDPVTDPAPASDAEGDEQVPDCDDSSRPDLETTLDDAREGGDCASEAAPCDTRPDDRLERDGWAPAYGGESGSVPCDPRICDPSS